MHDSHRIMGIHITDRDRRAGEVQRLLTEHGGCIKTRLGLHHVDENACSPTGLILLELFGDENVARSLRDQLAAVEGVEVQQMVFRHAAE